MVERQRMSGQVLASLWGAQGHSLGPVGSLDGDADHALKGPGVILG